MITWKFFWVSTFLFALASVYAQSENALARSGNKEFKEQKYAEAEVNYRKALEKKNNMPEAIFNLGDAVYQQKRFEDAAKQFKLSGQTNPDPIVKAKAYHNLGNTHMAQMQYEEAIKAYKQSLKFNPADRDTKYNLAYANRMLQQQQQQQQNQDKNKDKNEDQNKEKQQNKGEDNKQNQDNKDKQDGKQNEQNQQQANNDKKESQQQKQQQGSQPKLTKGEAEKLLQALQSEEQKANQKMQKATIKAGQVKIEKDW